MAPLSIFYIFFRQNTKSTLFFFYVGINTVYRICRHVHSYPYCPR